MSSTSDGATQRRSGGTGHAPSPGTLDPRLLRRRVAPSLLLSLSLLPACASPASVSADEHHPSYDERFAIVTQADVLDIQVFRDGTTLRLTNTTARTLPPGLIWVNARFSHPLSELSIGETIELSLHDFRDEFGGRFRAGGFFAAREPDRVVLAQLELPREPWMPEPRDPAAGAVRFGLVVVSNDIR